MGNGPNSNVRSLSGYPTIADFYSSRGTPIVINVNTGGAYVLLSDGVTIAEIGVSDPLFEISSTGMWRGKASMTYNIMGRRAGWVNTTDLQDLVQHGSGTLINYVDPAGAACEIVSTSASDTAAGTGARTVDIVYLDSTGTQLHTTATLNGVTPVSLGTSLHAVQWMEVATIGTGGVSAGNISLRNVATPTTIYEYISAGGNKSLSGRYKIPTGYVGYVVSWEVHAINNDIDARIRAQVSSIDRSLATVFHFDDNAYMSLNSSDDNPLPWFKYPAGCRIKMSAIPAGTAGTIRADASFQIVLVAI